MNTVIKGEFCGTVYAAKEFIFEGKSAAAEKAKFVHEITLHNTLKHPNIVLLMGAIFEPNIGYMLTEYVRGPDLDSFIFDQDDRYSFSTLSDKVKASMTTDMARALAYMHGLRPPMVHEDVKPCNFVVDIASVRKSLKLIELGISKRRNQMTMGKTTQLQYVEGTYSYMAPEKLLNSHPGSTAADVWSLGC